MAYFKHNEPEETRRNQAIPQEQDTGAEYNVQFDPQSQYDYGYEYDDDYDDGFDDPDEASYEEEELTEEEKKARKRDRIQLLFGAGDLTGIIIGTVVILLLAAFLVQMITFVRDDIRDFLDTIGRFF